MKAILSAIVVALIVACGGGGSSAEAAPLRADLLFGYYYSNSSTVNETRDHVNLHWSSYALGPAEQAAGLLQARANGQRAIVMLRAYDYALQDREAGIRLELTRLRDAGALWPGVVALYPQDEPDVNGFTDSEVTATNAMLHRVMREFGLDAALAVIYACGSGRMPGFASYGWIGCDAYAEGCGVLAGHVARIQAALTGSQRLLLPVGGADPWRQDPSCFERFAHATPIVVAVIAFLWQTEGAMVGIRDNGMRGAYCRVGRRIVGQHEQGC